MRINLWYCEQMSQWRWTLVDSRRPVCKMEAGQRPNIHDAMNDIANTVEHLLDKG